MNVYEKNLEKNKANFVPLTPLTFLVRAKEIYPNYEAVIYEDRNYTWSEVYKRCVKFASALSKIGIKKGDTVSFLAFNTPEIFEAHYSVPMTGAVLNTINIRLDAKTISYILEHGEAKVLVVDRQLHVEVKKALRTIKRKITIIDIKIISQRAMHHGCAFFHRRGINMCGNISDRYMNANQPNPQRIVHQHHHIAIGTCFLG